MQFKNVSKRFRGVIVVLSLGVLLSAGVTFAAWSTTTWHNPATWIKDGSVISAKNIADNFNYLYAKVTGQVNFNNPTFIEASASGYRAPRRAGGYPANSPSTATASNKSLCILNINVTQSTIDKFNGTGGCVLTQGGRTWTLKAFADKRASTVCKATCYY